MTRKRETPEKKLNSLPVEGKATYDTRYLAAWCTQYARPVLQNETIDVVTDALYEAANDAGAKIFNVRVSPEHVEVVFGAAPTKSLKASANAFKKAAAAALRENFPELKSKMSAIWSGRLFVCTIGHADGGTIDEFVAAEKKRSSPKTK